MKRPLYVLAAACFTLAFAFNIAHADSTKSPTVKIAIQDYAFKDPSITVAPGTTVTWTNMDDDPHTVTADDGSFDSRGLGQGDNFAHAFETTGKYPYHCAAHPFMKGIVIVEGASK